MNYTALIKTISTATAQLQGRAAAALNQALVIRNWMVGAWVIEFEQTGKDRAKYGARLLETLGRDAALEAVARHRPGALLIFPGPMFFGERERISAAMLKARIPVFAPEAEFVDAGCLISYAAPYTAMFRYATLHVKKLLAGTKPADLPVEQPTRFELVINGKTAKTLQIVMSQEMLLRADEVIE